MVPANTLVIPPEEEVVACDASKAGQCCGFACGVGFSAQACEVRVSLGWGEEFLCSGCTPCWDATSSAPFLADTSEATPGRSGDDRTVPDDPSVISQASRE